MEIERRFFIKNIEKVNELISEYKDSKKVIVQDYIFSDGVKIDFGHESVEML